MQDNSTAISPHFRCGYVAIIGEPNVGKSTLMNGLLGQKISIVTSKPQTTRHKILGILSTEAYQMIFLDTPGIIEPKYLLQEVMMRFASSAIADADLLMFMIDASKPRTEADLGQDEAFKRLAGLQRPVYLVINKIDCVEKSSLLPVIDFYSKQFAFCEIIPISALTSEGTKTLVQTLARDLPEHPPLYPLDIISDHHQRFFVSEIIREKLFLRCHEEIPYSTTVDIVEFNEREAGKWFIRADIYVERASQRGIVIGKGGSMLKQIGRMARQDVERFLDHPVYLELQVKVRENWRGDPQGLEQLGYRPGS